MDEVLKKVLDDVLPTVTKLEVVFDGRSMLLKFDAPCEGIQIPRGAALKLAELIQDQFE